MGPGRVLGIRGRPASVAPIAEADLLLVSVGEDVGLLSFVNTCAFLILEYSLHLD